MSLSFKELCGAVLDGVAVWHAEVAVCETLARADSIAIQCRERFPDISHGRVLTFAAGYWFVVLLVSEKKEDTDVTNNNS